MIFINLILITALIIVIISFMIAYSAKRSFKTIETGADHFAKGHLDTPIKISGSSHPAKTAAALNQMASRLAKQINTLTAERNELEAVFAAMSDGVVVIDIDQRIVTINNAGASLLNVNIQTSIGRGIAEIIYNPELQQLIRDVLDKKQTIENEIIIYKDGKRFFQVHGVYVDTVNGPRAVIVLADLTRLHHLENLRQEFVSNVSHELKTPITSIKGFVETLLEGAINEPEKSKEFLAIIARHTDRLNGIIEDLLSLSRIELETENRAITTEIRPVKDILISAAAACQVKAAEKRISISADCDENLSAKVNAPLLEQALINLIDNAIKYSEPEKTVTLLARQTKDQIEIDIKDEGYGIAPEHLPRIFERFYVIDKGRSRKLGGTGLGLAIVKHIVLAIGGNITVDSRVGKGSVFTIFLPKS